MNRRIDFREIKIDEWPTITTQGMPEKAARIVERRIAAMRLYVAGSSHAQIEVQTGLLRCVVFKLFMRCISTHADGRVWGFRACGFYARTKTYTRTAKAAAEVQWSGSGCAGLMGALFRRFPNIPEALVAEAQKSGAGSARPLLNEARIQRLFVELCRKAAIPGNQYPFNVVQQGCRSVRVWLRKELARRDLRRMVDSVYGEQAAARLGSGSQPIRTGSRVLPYERVEFDGHRMDFLATIEMPNPIGGEPIFLPVERIWFLALVDSATNVILGYEVCLCKEYSGEDVLSCLENALIPWKPRKLSHPGLAYIEGSGLPSGLIPELAYAKWGYLAFDNGKANLSSWVWDQVQKKIGCSLNPGPVATPERRQIIERFFGTLERSGFHKLPSTTGSNPSDPKRRDPDAAALKYNIRLDEILDLIDVVVAAYNATPTQKLHGRSPLEYLRMAVQKQSFLIQQIPEEKHGDFSMTTIPATGRILACPEKGVRPYVWYLGVRYYSAELAASVSLRNQKVRIEANSRDLRRIRIFLENGHEFGVLTAAQAWAGQAHDLRTRKAILRCIREGRLKRRDMPDVIQAYIDVKEEDAKKRKRARNELAHIQRLQSRAKRKAIENREGPPPPSLPPVFKKQKPPAIKISGKTFNF